MENSKEEEGEANSFHKHRFKSPHVPEPQN